MLRIDAGRSGRYCDGMSRRSFVQLGVAGMAAASLGDVARAKQSAATGNNNAAIMIWLDGGPSHLDMYDMKPEAPSEYRGIWMPTATNVPGVEITEMFPLQAQHADKFSIVRSLHHDTGGHFHGG
ncbi:MAG: DUF1501 domain-containing protein, partial [Planctomycetota bacterium]|nr:DUF1501 domain-containing protein [Planctomycetota bacterium]